ncbi:MAG: peroxiredoxin family protein [Candidatus Oleimicrobiaceae bacterium]
MKSRAIHLLVAAIVLVNVTTLVVWWVKSHRPRSGGPQGPPVTYFKYGDVAPRFRFRSVPGQVIDSDSLRGETVLLEFFDAEDDQHWSQILYADMLAKVYGDRGLEVIAISKNRPRRLRQFAGTISVPIVVDDDSLSIHNLFHLREFCGGTVLIDPAGVIRFITAYLAPGGTMRQVLEVQLAEGSTGKAGFEEVKR